MAEDPLCQSCVAQLGLCERHAPAVLPQRAIPPWVYLIGDSHIEQKQLQLDPHEAIAVDRAKRREARKRARRGLTGLLAHIATA